MLSRIAADVQTVHPNWIFGWLLMLTAFVTGAGLGMFFYREDFLGGYSSFRRRIVRLGHISLAMLGIVNVLYGLTPQSIHIYPLAGIGLMLGGLTMPAVCFLAGWRAGFRHLFFIPVCFLILAVCSILFGAFK